MAETNPEEWQNIKTSCDGETTCDYVYPGQITTDCALNDKADYVQLAYQCSNIAAFSVYTNWGFMAYEGTILTFGLYHIMDGGHYDWGIYTCPKTAYYYFYFNLAVVLEAYDGDDEATLPPSCTIYLKMDGDIKATVRVSYTIAARPLIIISGACSDIHVHIAMPITDDVLSQTCRHTVLQQVNSSYTYRPTADAFTRTCTCTRFIYRRMRACL